MLKNGRSVYFTPYLWAYVVQFVHTHTLRMIASTCKSETCMNSNLFTLRRKCDTNNGSTPRAYFYSQKGKQYGVYLAKQSADLSSGAPGKHPKSGSFPKLAAIYRYLDTSQQRSVNIPLLCVCRSTVRIEPESDGDFFPDILFQLLYFKQQFEAVIFFL